MTRLRRNGTSIIALSALATVTVFSGAASSESDLSRPLIKALASGLTLAQAGNANAFPLPTNVPVGTKVRIGGSSSMETINQVLKKRFEQQFVGTNVELNTQGTGPAIKDLLDGNADLAAIGRSLTEQEKAQGLVAVPVSRHKIAIIVGSENPFKGSLTFEQFAKVFRGEIKDWSQLGGAFGAIRLIDRPDSSDTRQAFRNYPVFKRVPFVTGTTAKQLAQDSTSQVVQALGKDGIGYAIADQLQGRGDVRVLPMHNVLPSNPKYPFSQPLVYVYKGPQPNPSAQAFLGYATAPASRQTIETARKDASATIALNSEPAPSGSNVTVPGSKAIPAPKTIASSVPTTPATASPSSKAPVGDTPLPDTIAPWWLWLLGLPLLGGFFWWLLKRRDAQFEPDDDPPEATLVVPSGAESIAPAIAANPDDRVSPVADSATSVDHSVDHGVNPDDGRPAGKGLAGDVLAADEWNRTALAGDRSQFPLSANNSLMTGNAAGIPPQATAFYTGLPASGLGLVASAGLVQSSPLTFAGEAAHGMVRDRPLEQAFTDHVPLEDVASDTPYSLHQSQIMLVPRGAQSAYVYWDVNQSDKDALKHQGGHQLMLRVYAVTGTDATPAYSTQQFLCNEWEHEQQVPIAVSNLDYVAELGYTTLDGRFLSLARSPHTRVSGA